MRDLPHGLRKVLVVQMDSNPKFPLAPGRPLIIAPLFASLPEQTSEQL
jgi:hypothetical protein